MRITVLADNTKNPTKPNLLPEHGLSLYVEVDSHRILFDAGASSRFLQNACLLGVNVKSIDVAVLSHGHFDHGGGLHAFMKQNPLAPLYAGPGAFEAHFAKVLGMIYLPVGIRKSKLHPFQKRLVVVDSLSEVLSKVFILPTVTLFSNPPGDMNTFYCNTSRGKERDAFQHEIVLVIQETDGIVILTGCSHKGILNIVRSIESSFPAMPIKAIVGGMHMTNALTKKLLQSEQEIRVIGTTLYANTKIAKIFSGHCTGQKAYGILRRDLKEKLSALMVGIQIEL